MDVKCKDCGKILNVVAKGEYRCASCYLLSLPKNKKIEAIIKGL